MEMAGKVAIVTGSGGEGSGRAEARRFARDGAAVVVCDVNEAGGRETVRLIETAGGRAAFARADMGIETDIRALFAFAEKTYVGVDILVNNASAPYADGRIYSSNQDGATYVLSADREFKLLATNLLDAGCMASPAVYGKALYVRTKTHLYRIEQ
jgi:NAD(P)-dependent dehydrogenase (short-subunit alcohol dehydrogenase family)